MTTSGSVMSWIHGLSPCRRAITWLFTALLFVVTLFCSAVEAVPVKHVYMVVYTVQGKGLQAGKKIVVGAEEIPAEVLAFDTHPVENVQLLSYIQTSPKCQSGLCTQLDMQTHEHYSVTGDGGEDKAVTVHTAMVDLGQDWDERVTPHAYVQKGDGDEVDLNAVSVFVRGGSIYPVVETKLPYFSKGDGATSLVVGQYTPQEKIATVANFPEKGTVVIDTGGYIHALAIFRDQTKTYASFELVEQKKHSGIVLHSREPGAFNLSSTQMLPTPQDLKQDQQSRKGPSPLTVYDKAAAPNEVAKLLNQTIIHATDTLTSHQETWVEVMVPYDFKPENHFIGLYHEENKEPNKPLGFASLKIPKDDPGPHRVKLTPGENTRELSWVNLYMGKDESSLLYRNYSVDDQTKSSAMRLHAPSPKSKGEEKPKKQKNTFATIRIGAKAHSVYLQELKTESDSLKKKLQKLETELEAAKDPLALLTQQNEKLKEDLKSSKQSAQVLQQQLREQDEQATNELRKYEQVSTQLQDALSRNAVLVAENEERKKENSADYFGGEHTDDLAMKALKNRVSQLEQEITQLRISQTPSVVVQHSPITTLASSSSSESLKCTLLGGLSGNKTKPCNGEKKWNKDGYVKHLIERHSGQTDLRASDSCPGCKKAVSNLLDGGTSMSEFILHITACSGFPDGK